MAEHPPESAPVIPGQIRVRGVSRQFKVMHDKALTLKETVLRRRRVVATEFRALEDVDLDVAPGEAVGIVGRNGSGKSTLLKILAGILSPHEGTVELGGTVTSMLELGSGFHPDFTGRENVLMNGAIHGFSEDEIAGRVEEIVDFAELWEFIDNPVRTYSSGMQMRLGYAVAAHLRPDVLLLDEVLSVGDEAFQRKCIANIFDYRRHGGTLVFVSHDPGAVERVCSRAVLMHDGHIVEEGAPGEVLADYRKLLVSTGAGARSGDVHEHDAPSDGPAPAPEPVVAPDLVLDGYRLLGPSGVTDRIMSGDPLAVEVDLVAEGGLERVHARIGIVSDEGPIVCESAKTIRVREGEVTTLRLDLPDLHLNTGGFSVSFSLADADMTPFEHREHILPFNVFPRESSRSMLAVSGTWTSAGYRAGPAQGPHGRSRVDRRRAIRNGVRVGGREGHVLVVAGSDPHRLRGGGLAVYDGRSLEVLDRVSTVGLLATPERELIRLVAPSPGDPLSPLEIMRLSSSGLTGYRRCPPIHVDGLAGDGASIVVATAGALVWIDLSGDIIRREPGDRIPEGMVVRCVGNGPSGPIAVISADDEDCRVIDLRSGRPAPEVPAGVVAIDAHDSGWLIADRQEGVVIASSSRGGVSRRMDLEAASALARTDDLVAVGQRPHDPLGPLGGTLALLDIETLHPLVNAQLPFAGVSSIAVCPAEIVPGLRAAASDLHGLLSAGAGREEGWILDAKSFDPSEVPGQGPRTAIGDAADPRSAHAPALERR